MKETNAKLEKRMHKTINSVFDVSITIQLYT